jgi:putative hydrolase of the HAD superfamily
MVRAVASDFGGVVGQFSHGLILQRIAGLGGCSAEQARQHVFQSGLEEDFDCGRISAADFYAQLRRSCRIPERVGDAVLASIWRGIFSRTAENERVIAALLRVPRSVPLVLASNTNEEHFVAIEEQFGDLTGSCDVLVLSHRVGCRKPAEAFFRRVIEAGGAAADETLFIDDRPDFVQAAARLGMRARLYAAGVDVAGVLASVGVELSAGRRG